jgi:uncharacterized membrane protein
MNKAEFLAILRQALSGEVTNAVIEQNIRYYDEYISTQSAQDESEIIERLGDPRLIAKTIIEAEKAAKEKSRYSWSSTDYREHAAEADEEYRENVGGNGRRTVFTNLKWYHKLFVVLGVILLFVVIALIGRLVIGFLFAFGLPILIILLVMSLFRRR